MLFKGRGMRLVDIRVSVLADRDPLSVSLQSLTWKMGDGDERLPLAAANGGQRVLGMLGTPYRFYCY